MVVVVEGVVMVMAMVVVGAVVVVVVMVAVIAVVVVGEFEHSPSRRATSEESPANF